MTEKAVIFDLDGTLYDNTGFVPMVALNDPLSAWMMLNERLMRRALKGRYMGERCFDIMMENLAARAHCTPEYAKKWFDTRYMPVQAKTLRRFYHAKPWVKPTLEQLKAQGIKICCFSDYGHVSEKLKAIGIDPSIFDFITDAPSTGGLKPSGDAFLYVAKQLGVEPGNCLVCGDRPDTDGEGAAAAGMAFQLIPRHDMNILTLNL